MYENLVNRLRKEEGPAIDFPDTLYDEAADAIEELSKLADAIPQVCECCIGCEVESGGCDRGFVLSPKRAREYLSKFRWNPVAERLPSAYKEVLLRFPHNQAAGFYDRDGCWAVYSGDGFYTEVADNEPKPTHWMKKLPEPPKEETR